MRYHTPLRRWLEILLHSVIACDSSTWLLHDTCANRYVLTHIADTETGSLKHLPEPKRPSTSGKMLARENTKQHNGLNMGNAPKSTWVKGLSLKVALWTFRNWGLKAGTDVIGSMFHFSSSCLPTYFLIMCIVSVDSNLILLHLNQLRIWFTAISWFFC
jgi:hypothetical protein